MSSALLLTMLTMLRLAFCVSTQSSLTSPVAHTVFFWVLLVIPGLLILLLAFLQMSTALMRLKLLLSQMSPTLSSPPDVTHAVLTQHPPPRPHFPSLLPAILQDSTVASLLVPDLISRV